MMNFKGTQIFALFKRLVSFGPKRTLPVTHYTENLGNTLDISIEVRNSVMVIINDNPRKRNCLTPNIVSELKDNLLVAKYHPDICAVLMHNKTNEDKSYFCCGGDVKSLYLEGVPVPGKPPITTLESMKIRRQFFRDEYTVNYLTANLNKPFISLIYGNCIGGGNGLIAHCKYSLAYDCANFIMPECKIGFFPDTGAGKFLSSMPQNLGMMMGLTGYTFKGEEANYCGLVTHFTHVKKGDVPAGILLMGVFREYIEPSIAILMRIASGTRFTRSDNIEIRLFDEIETIFGLPTVEEIFEECYEKACGEFWGENTWRKIYEGLLEASPTSLKVTHRYLNLAKNMPLEECLKYEYRIAQNFMRHHDFYEGVRCKLIDKNSKPRWKPALLDDVTDEDVDKFFNLPDGDEDLDVVKESQQNITEI